MKGRIIASPVQTPIKGIQVYHPKYYIDNINAIDGNLVTLLKEENSLVFNINHLSTFDVIDLDGNSYPLEYSQWAIAIGNQLIDRDIIIDFEIIPMIVTMNHPEFILGSTHIGRISKMKTYTLDELKRFAFFAVQHASKLQHKDGKKVITKNDIDSYLDSETSL